ncbi:MAG: aminodeoxychorismate lyase [Thiobacillaceae bacterium]|nr:aminodeoxychorismate lyase [Thiobacillaceae bacterium]
MNLVNGVPGDCVSARDRGLAYGDGVFRTLRVRGGQPMWWQDHYAKLEHDAAALNLPCPQATVLQDEIEWLAAGQDGVAKLILTRGGGPRGYAPPPQPQVTRIVTFDSSPADSAEQGVADISVRWCDLRLGRQPRLAGIKHLNRLENVLARAEWQDPAIREGLLCDDTDAVVSGVTSNIFIVSAGVLKTPDLSQCGVAGVARSRILRAARERGIDAEVTRILPDTVMHADEVMLCNSVQGRVATLDGKNWSPAGWSETLNGWLYEVD